PGVGRMRDLECRSGDARSIRNRSPRGDRSRNGVAEDAVIPAVHEAATTDDDAVQDALVLPHEGAVIDAAEALDEDRQPACTARWGQVDLVRGVVLEGAEALVVEVDRGAVAQTQDADGRRLRE